jgi:type II secretory pathway pseudopilin PulG
VKADPRTHRQGGYTILELVIALFLTLFVALAAGAIVLTNQSSFRQGQGKLTMQQDASRAVEQIARDVRRARWIDYDAANPDRLALLNAAGGQFRLYELGASGGVQKVLQDGAPLADQECTELSFAANADTTAVSIVLELRDAADNRVKMESTAAIRNRNFPDKASP